MSWCDGAFWQFVLVDIPCCLYSSPVLLFLLCRLLTASGHLHPVFLERTSDLHLPLGDAVHGWLAVSSFSCPSFCSSSWSQLLIPKLYLSTGITNDPNAWNLFLLLLFLLLHCCYYYPCYHLYSGYLLLYT